MSTQQKPNILYIITDQQSADMMSCVGNKDLNTPAMDYLASIGTRFDKAYCSNPVCQPSRISLFSGHYPSVLNIKSNDRPEIKTPSGYFKNCLGNLLKNAGYNTFYGGKQHFVYKPHEIGFDLFSTDERHQLAQSASEILRNYDSEKPFFMGVSLVNPHDICAMSIHDPDSYSDEKDPDRHFMNYKNIEYEVYKMWHDVKKLDDDQLPELPANFQLQNNEPDAISELIEQRNFKHYLRHHWTERKWREHRYVYCRLTELVDKQIQTILDSVPDNTLIIFTSDHGEHDGAHRLDHKSTFYEEVTRVPLIIAKPNAVSSDAKINEQLCSNAFDVYATICDYAGIQVPEEVEVSYSLRSIIENKSENTGRELLKIECEFGTAVHSYDKVYAKYFRGENSEQLYDLVKDPGQMNNYIDHPEYQDDISILKKALSESIVIRA